MAAPPDVIEYGITYKVLSDDPQTPRGYALFTPSSCCADKNVNPLDSYRFTFFNNTVPKEIIIKKVKGKKSCKCLADYKRTVPFVIDGETYLLADQRIFVNPN